MPYNIFHIASTALKLPLGELDNSHVVDFILAGDDGTVSVKNSEGTEFILTQENGYITAEEVGRTIRWGDDDYYDHPDLAGDFNNWGRATA